jgi:hypothetical protein
VNFQWQKWTDARLVIAKLIREVSHRRIMDADAEKRRELYGEIFPVSSKDLFRAPTRVP